MFKKIIFLLLAFVLLTCTIVSAASEPKLIKTINNGLTKKINVYNIVYIEVISHHIYIYENVDQAYIVYMTLKEFMDEVNLKYIVQIHKSYLVNLLYVEKIEGQICYLKGGVALSLGRKYKNEFIERYEELM